jgi:hypothetical protein
MKQYPLNVHNLIQKILGSEGAFRCNGASYNVSIASVANRHSLLVKKKASRFFKCVSLKLILPENICDVFAVPHYPVKNPRTNTDCGYFSP